MKYTKVSLHSLCSRCSVSCWSLTSLLYTSASCWKASSQPKEAGQNVLGQLSYLIIGPIFFLLWEEHGIRPDHFPSGWSSNLNILLWIWKLVVYYIGLPLEGRGEMAVCRMLHPSFLVSLVRTCAGVNSTASSNFLLLSQHILWELIRHACSRGPPRHIKNQCRQPFEHVLQVGLTRLRTSVSMEVSHSKTLNSNPLPPTYRLLCPLLC